MNRHQLAAFILLAAVSCLLSGLTTIGIHAFFSYGSLNFEESVRLFQNPLYLLNRWWVITHCLLVILSMWGFFLLQYRKSPGFAGLGFVFFSVFAFTEIFRQLMVFFYLNGLRRNYLAATDPGLQTWIQYSIENFGLISYALFGLFILTFGLGNLCYGITLTGGNKFDKILSFLLIFWALTSLAAFFNEFWQLSWLSEVKEKINIIYQPAVRFLIGFWLLKHWHRLKLSLVDH